MKRHISNEVLCPFYISEDEYRVRCEGVEDGTTTHVVFPDPKKKSTYKLLLCCDKYKRCRIAKALYSKYEEGEK